jgi:Holliday junction resolvase
MPDAAPLLPKKKKVNSRAKGARGEREFRDELRNAGYDARRGQQFAGGTDSPDVVCPALAFAHFEVKRTQAISIQKVMSQQAERDAKHKLPIIAHKSNGGQWLVVLKLSDFFALLNNADHAQLNTQYAKKA